MWFLDALALAPGPFPAYRPPTTNFSPWGGSEPTTGYWSRGRVNDDPTTSVLGKNSGGLAVLGLLQPALLGSFAPGLLGSGAPGLQVPVRGAGHPELAYLPHEGGLARPTAPIPQMEFNELGPSEAHGNANVPDYSGIPPRLELSIPQRAPSGHDGPPGR